MQIFFDWMYKLASGLGRQVLKLLPTSPFRSFIDGFQAPQYLGWLNWFFPVSEIISILVLWLSAVALFYLYSVIMRWVKLIGD